jgi:hypothetical protein
VWWVSTIGIAVFAIWLWREKGQDHQTAEAAATDPKPIKRSQFEKAVWWVLGILVLLFIVLPILVIIIVGAADT